MIEILPFRQEFIDDAAVLFTRGWGRLRTSIPAVPDWIEAPGIVAQLLKDHLLHNVGVVALENGRFAGYLTWFEDDGFHGTQVKGAYCPEWGHGAQEGHVVEIYRALYREASRQWALACCKVHAITLLSIDRAAIDAWFWNGFGLFVVDGVRPLCGLEESLRTDLEVRKATPVDVPALVELDAEHWQHYTKPPIFMSLHHSQDVQAAMVSISTPGNSAWLACDQGSPVGFIRFAGGIHDGIYSIGSPTTVGITGAYVRPAYRGRGAAAVMLDMALRDYAKQGYSRCGVDFESFNPEAAAFWPKYFQPVAYSLVRVPEEQH